MDHSTVKHPRFGLSLALAAGVGIFSLIPVAEAAQTK